MTAKRTILHVDMDAFFASVEQRDNPMLQGKPVVVGSPPSQRGVVSAASYEARRFGVCSAMPSSEAYRRCPQAIFVPVNAKKYRAASQAIFEIFHRFTPEVEPLSIDEAFLDVTGAQHLFGSGREIAESIRNTIVSETALTASVGIASNKFLAKLASDMNKPNGITEVPRESAAVAAFLAPLPVRRIWGVGKVTAEKLESRGLSCIGDIQRIELPSLRQMLGESLAEHLYMLAWGRDERTVATQRSEKSISREHTYDTDVSDPELLRSTLNELVNEVGQDLRRHGWHARTVRLKLRWDSFQTITRQHSLETPLCDDFSLWEEALKIFDAQTLLRPVRLIGFGVSGFDEHTAPAAQLDLFTDTNEEKRHRREKLNHAMDAVRKRFGPDGIRRGHKTKNLSQ